VHHVQHQSVQVAAVTILLAVLSVGCSTTQVSPEPREVVAFGLPSITAPPNFGGCVGEDPGVKLILRGSANQSPVAFARRSDGRVAPIVWPPGYRAEFTPGLVIVSPLGQVVAHEGDDITADPLQWPGLFICFSPTDVAVYLRSSLRSGG